jgi:hypothetical protein
VLSTSKLLSPQYLLWVFPVVAYVEGLRLRWVLVAVLTLVIFPYGYGLDASLIRLPNHPLFMAAIFARNGILVAVTFAYLAAAEHASWLGMPDEVRRVPLFSEGTSPELEAI